MKSGNGRMIIHNAMNDFTEMDRVRANYRLLWANKFKTELEDQERQKSFNLCIRTAIRDLSVWLVVIVVFALAMVIAARW